MTRTFGIAGLALMLSACATTPEVPPARAPAAVPDGAFRAPNVMRGLGAESVIGEGASSLTRRFGAARIDLVEGDARKLQFASETCVLDIYLYPMNAGTAPVATHVETRLRQGGGPIERADCIAQVERERR